MPRGYTPEQQAYRYLAVQKDHPEYFQDRIERRENLEIKVTEPTTETTFGVEIEILVPEAHSTRSIAQYLRDNGIKADYTHNPLDKVESGSWKVTTDSSCGYEIVSPVLLGEKGLREVEKVVKLLKVIAKVNTKCGLHVHIGAQNLTAWDVRNILLRYQNAEKTIDSIMPKHRQKSNCPHAMSLWVTHYYYSLTKLPKDKVTLKALIALQHDRYSKLNLHSLALHGTIEYRQHSGTLSAKRVTNWIQFCLNFTESTTEENINDVSYDDIFTGTINDYYKTKVKG